MPFWQAVHLHLGVHLSPSWKHSQYFFRHLLFLQLQPLRAGNELLPEVAGGLVAAVDVVVLSAAGGVVGAAAAAEVTAGAATAAGGAAAGGLGGSSFTTMRSIDAETGAEAGEEAEVMIGLGVGRSARVSGFMTLLIRTSGREASDEGGTRGKEASEESATLLAALAFMAFSFSAFACSGAAR